jgi:diacylglycerol kinase family enzyme
VTNSDVPRSSDPTNNADPLVNATATASSRSVAVVHPLKSGGVEAATDRLARWAAEAGVPAPEVRATTPDSPGGAQARQAVADGADLVIAWGGDGTVTAVAESLVGCGVPLGVIPAGTGNLLCRNLGIPLDIDRAGAVVFAGADRLIDVVEIGLGGRATVSAVMAGIGLDAVLIDADEDLKAAIGSTAYVVNAAKALGHRRMRVGVSVDGGPPRWVSARSVLVANVGGLIGGLDVVPEADASDGLLHVVVLTLSRPSDWVRTAGRLVTRRGGVDRSRLHLTGTSAWVVTTEDQPRQVDGEVVEPGRRMQARMRPASLLVRVPR